MISIVIPAFNAENTLAETIDSALDSGLSTQQIILVDDGSEDSTWDLISKYSSKYKCIDKHHAQKSYVSPLYNKSLSKKISFPSKFNWKVINGFHAFLD